MLETLTNLKNNKIKQATARQVQGNAAEHLKKFLSGLGKTRHRTGPFQLFYLLCRINCKHPVMPHDPLRASLDDLHSAETRGKWWLVGAAWSGDPLVEAQNSKHASTRQNSDEDALLKLAKRQGMNTDIRRSIFVVLMSSDVRPTKSCLQSYLHGTGLRRCLRATCPVEPDRGTATRSRPCACELLR